MLITDLGILLYEKTKKSEDYLIVYKILQLLIFDHPSFSSILDKFLDKCQLLKLKLPVYLQETFEKLEITHEFLFGDLPMLKKESSLIDYVNFTKEHVVAFMKEVYS